MPSSADYTFRPDIRAYDSGTGSSRHPISRLRGKLTEQAAPKHAGSIMENRIPINQLDIKQQYFNIIIIQIVTITLASMIAPDYACFLAQSLPALDATC